MKKKRKKRTKNQNDSNAGYLVRLQLFNEKSQNDYLMKNYFCPFNKNLFEFHKYFSHLIIFDHNQTFYQ